MAYVNLTIKPADVEQDVVRSRAVEYSTGECGYISMDLGDAITVYVGDFDAACVTVARALAVQLTKAADDLEALMAARPLPPSDALVGATATEPAAAAVPAVSSTREIPL